MQTKNRAAVLFVFRVEGKARVANRRIVTDGSVKACGAGQQTPERMPKAQGRKGGPGFGAVGGVIGRRAAAGT